MLVVPDRQRSLLDVLQGLLERLELGRKLRDSGVFLLSPGILGIITVHSYDEGYDQLKGMRSRNN